MTSGSRVMLGFVLVFGHWCMVIGFSLCWLPSFSSAASASIERAFLQKSRAEALRKQSKGVEWRELCLAE
jgi:hypothetical protein